MKILVRALPTDESECSRLLRGAGVELIGPVPETLGPGYGAAFSDFRLLEAVDKEAVDRLRDTRPLRVIPLNSLTFVVTAEAECG
jgi:hypothetical protein